MKNMSMERIIDMHNKNKKVTEGETILFNGEEFEVPPMSEEEINKMIEEGEEIGNIEIGVKGEEVKLIDIDDGRKLYKRLEVLNLEGNLASFWFAWRENQIEKGINNLPKNKQKAIRQMLKR